MTLEDLAVLEQLDDTDILAITLWGEARGEPLEGILAVACVIRNRAHRRDQTYREVCLQPWQFSCWKPEGGQSNYAAVVQLCRDWVAGNLGKESQVLKECQLVAEYIRGGYFRDRTNGADHYYAPEAMPHGTEPSWADGADPVCEIGGHLFFRLE